MDRMRRAWVNEVRWWNGNMQARWHGNRALSSKAGDRDRMRACASAAAMCIAGAVVLGSAWVALAKRWRTPSRPNREPAKENDAASRALVVAYLRAVGTTPTVAVVRSPQLLLLCAAPGVKDTPQRAAEVPALVSAMPLSSVAATGVLFSGLPLLVAVDVETGELVVRMTDDSIFSAVFPNAIDAHGCGWRSARRRRSAPWRRELQAANDETRTTLTSTNPLREKAWGGPAFSRDPPLLLLCAPAAEEEAPPARQIDVTRAPVLTLSPSLLLPSLPDMGVFLSSIPVLVGVGDTATEVSIPEVPRTETVVTSSLFLSRAREDEEDASLFVAGILLKTTLPLLLCDQARTAESLGPAATTKDLQAMTDAGDGVVVTTMPLDSSPPKVARRASASPSTSASARQSLWTLPSSNVHKGSPSQGVVSNTQPTKTPLASTMLWGLPVVKRAKPEAGDPATPPRTNAPRGQARRVLGASSADPAPSPKGGWGVSDSADGACGGGRLSKASHDGGGGSGDGGAGSSSPTGKKTHAVWTLPGQTRFTARAGAGGRIDANALMSALGKAHHFPTSAEIAGKPLFTREGECGTSGDCDDGGVGASPGDRERPSLSGSLLRSALALSAQTPPVAASRGRTDARSPSWALGKARRGSLSPEFVGKSVPSQGDGGGAGRDGRATKASHSRRVAGVRSGAGTAPPPPPSPRSILVTSKAPTSARRAAAISRGVRWLDIIQKEEERAISRRKRAARWTGGCRKREGPPSAGPRASRALVFARESEAAAASWC